MIIEFMHILQNPQQVKIRLKVKIMTYKNMHIGIYNTIV